MTIAKLFRWNLNNPEGSWEFQQQFETTEDNARKKLEVLPNVDSKYYFYKFQLEVDEVFIGEVFTCNCFLFI